MVAIVLVASLLGACKGDSAKTTAQKASTAPSAAAAKLKVRDEAGTVTKAGASAAAPAKEAEAVATGDTVATNGTGFIELDYLDGSLARLDSNASFTLTTLAAAAGHRQIVGTLDSGRVWNKVTKLTATDNNYEIDTKVATAAVRGTQFDVNCAEGDGACYYTVVEGVVRVTPQGGQPIDVTAGHAMKVASDFSVTGPTAFDVTQLSGVPWIAKNMTADAVASGGASSSTTTAASTAKAIDACAALSDADLAFVLDKPVRTPEPNGRIAGCQFVGHSSPYATDVRIDLQFDDVVPGGAYECSAHEAPSVTCAPASGFGEAAALRTQDEGEGNPPAVWLVTKAHGKTVSVRADTSYDTDDNARALTGNEQETIVERLTTAVLAHLS